MICDNNNQIQDIVVTKATVHDIVIGMYNVKNLNIKYPNQQKTIYGDSGYYSKQVFENCK